MKTVLLVLSRDYENSPSSGRKTIISNYLDGLSKCYQVKTIVIQSFFNQSSVKEGGSLAYRVLKNIIERRYPFQSLLYLSRSEIDRLNRCFREVEPDYVLIDGVRLVPAVTCSDIIQESNVILDIDDVLSYRYEGYLYNSYGIQFGIFGRKFSFLKKVIPYRFQQRFLEFEISKLKELEMVSYQTFQKIVFSSITEMNSVINGLDRKYISDNKFYSQVFPYVSKKSALTTKTLTFGFLGSDKAVQNKETIKYLTNLWTKYNVKYKLILAGDIDKCNYKNNDNITYSGYLPSLDSFYDSIDLVIAPSFVKGGVKTKVIESFCNEVAVIGNETSFEGVPISANYPGKLSEEELIDLLTSKLEVVSNKYDSLMPYCNEVSQYSSKINHSMLIKKVFS
ncbi:glycosyltransferase [Vibrio mediterranei]|uniref:glycosyltransferase n=1 Tax=Vibrio mediterranei TaxID=689 RepID=UPI00148C3AD8|nr:glycosyltransferase [Vibrio mediterranei]NOH29029.1 glycosyltransferase [Vibrio mediterranei]